MATLYVRGTPALVHGLGPQNVRPPQASVLVPLLGAGRGVHVPHSPVFLNDRRVFCILPFPPPSKERERKQNHNVARTVVSLRHGLIVPSDAERKRGHRETQHFTEEQCVRPGSNGPVWAESLSSPSLCLRGRGGDQCLMSE